MNRMMMTVAALALAAPAYAQDAATTTEAPAGTTPMTETAPADGTTAPADGTMAPADGTMAPADGTMAPADGTMAQDPAAPMTTDGTTAPMDAPADGMATEGAVTTQPMATEPGMAGDTEATALSATNPGITASWLTDRAIYTTNQPSTTAWTETTGDTVPGDWNEIANVSDLVMTADGELVGYVADIGGFLGLGAHTVLLDKDMLHVTQFGDDVVLATNYTQEELEALPEFDTDSVMQ